MIREFKLRDMDRILKIWLDASCRTHNFIDKDFWVSKVSDMRNVYIPASETYVYEHRGEIYGFLSLHENSLDAVYVAPDQQRKGIGKKLTDKAKELRTELKLCVYKENKDAISFYGKCGFKKDKVQLDKHTGHPEIVMRWKSQPHYRLYNFQPSGNCYKIRLLLKQLDIPFESIPIDIVKKESRTPKFLKKNPNGRVPVLQVNDKYLPESNAALWYLAKGTRFLPNDDFSQARVLQWMFFEQYSHEPNIATVRYWVAILNAKNDFTEQISAKTQAGYAALDVMEKHLCNHSFFVADQYTIADIALYAYTHVAHEGGFDLSGYKYILQWIKAVESQPGHIKIDCDI